MKNVKTPTVVKSADRALEILEFLATTPATKSLAEISGTLKIPRSSLHGLLRTMQNRDWVSVDETGSRFWVGPQSLTVGASYLSKENIVADTNNLMNFLSLELGEAIHLGVLIGNDVMYLAKRDALHSLRLVSRVGIRFPAHATALGKVLLAEWGKEALKQNLNFPLQALTHKTLISWPAFEQSLQAVHTQGFAIDNEESTEGVRCFAVTLEASPPRTHAISCSVPIARLDSKLEKHIVKVLKAATREYAANKNSQLIGSM